MCCLTHCSCLHSSNSFSVLSNQRGLVTCTPVPQLRLSVACRAESKLLRQAFKAFSCLPCLLAGHTPTFSSLYPVLQKLAAFVLHHTFSHPPCLESQLRLSPPPGNLPEHQAGHRHFLSPLQCRRKRHQFGGSTAISLGLLSMIVALTASLSEGSTGFPKSI